jgi:hypothetical protein
MHVDVTPRSPTKPHSSTDTCQHQTIMADTIKDKHSRPIYEGDTVVTAFRGGKREGEVYFLSRNLI